MTPAALEAANAEAVRFVAALRHTQATRRSPILVSGAVGPRGDGYNPDRLMTADEAEAYHARQVAVLTAAGADMVSALTMSYLGEAVGIARAAEAVAVPVVVSFTVETDGRLRDGTTVAAAVAACDAATGGYPAYYMLNCAHPSHFRGELAEGAWRGRIGGIRANASRLSHAELDAAPELDEGDPAELARDYRELVRLLPGLRVLGGCCGTDHRHVGAISGACGLAHA
jgi:homocysteine S-methyltransferase